MSKKEKIQPEKLVETKEQKAEREAKQKAAGKKIYIACVVVVIAAIITAFGVLIYQRVGDHIGSYVKIGEYEVSKGEVDFYYNAVVSNYESQYYSYYSYLGIDTSLPYSEQQYSEDLTWEDYFMQGAIESMQEIYALYDAAIKSDMEYDAKKLVDEEMTAIEEAAADSGYTLKEYIALAYGDVSISKFKKYIEKQLIAAEYSDYLKETYNVTDEMIAEEIEENKENYYLVSYRSYAISFSTGTDATDEEKEALQTEAKKTADDLAAKITDEESYKTVISEYDETKDFDIDDATLVEDYFLSNVNAQLSEWMLKEDRKSGDIGVVEGTSSYYVVYFDSIERNESTMVAFRHILLSDSDVAEENAETMLAYWKEKGSQEDMFAEMADRYSTDTGSNTNGGLYENVGKGEMVEGIDEWLFDDARKAGDTAIIESTYGQHIMYFVSATDDLYVDYVATETLKNNYVTETTEELVKNMKIVDLKGKIAYLKATETDVK